MSYTRTFAVTAAPSKTGFTSLANVKAELGAIAADPLIERLIDQVSEEIAADLGWPEANHTAGGGRGHPIAEAAYAETFRLGCAVECLQLSRRWLVAAPAVTIDGEALAAEEIEAELSTGHLYRLSGGVRACWSGTLVATTWRAGFKMPEDEDNAIVAPSRRMPAQLERAAIDLIAYRWTIATGQPCGAGAPIDQMQFPGAGMINFAIQTPGLAGSMPKQVVEILDRFRNQVIA